MGEYGKNKLPLKMHSEAWWTRAMDAELSPEEERAWQQHLATCASCRAEWKAWLEVETLFQSAPLPELPAAFVEDTLARWEAARRRRYAIGLVSAFFLILLVWGLILVSGSSCLRDILNAGDVLLASRELLFHALLRVGASLTGLGSNIFPWLLGACAFLYFSLVFNGTLAATVTLLLVNKKRATTLPFN